MRIVADHKIAFVEAAFGSLGELSLLPGQAITPDVVADADILLVRSITRVDEILLKDSKVRFVGTATIGHDHIDTDFLHEKGIIWASAPGCNATAVAEYVLTALLWLAGEREFSLAEKSLAVVGVGNIGSKVVRIAQALGMQVLQNDPPLARATGDRRYLPLDAVMSADIITLHVPLIRQGEDATWHLFDGERIAKLKRGCILFNTSRGSVVETGALKEAIIEGHVQAAVLDVWENEPFIDTELLELTTLATPHIAGYSLEGKVKATWLIYQALCRFLNVEPEWNPDNELSPSGHYEIVGNSEPGLESILWKFTATRYAIEDDDKRLRQLLSLEPGQQGAYFEQLRASYPLRKEFSSTPVSLRSSSSELGNRLTQIGFKVH